MVDRTEDCVYHRRRAAQEQRLAMAATGLSTKLAHEQLAQFHLDRLHVPGGLKVVQPE